MQNLSAIASPRTFDMDKLASWNQDRMDLSAISDEVTVPFEFERDEESEKFRGRKLV